MSPTSILTRLSAVILTSLSIACGDQNPDQLIKKETWDLVGWSDKGPITKDMESLPTVIFKDGRIFGNGGINSFDGRCRAKANGTIRINDLSMTERGGPPEIMRMEQTYTDILSKVTQWSIQEDTLILSDGTDNNQLHYKTGIRKIDRPLKHQDWTLIGVQVINEDGRTVTALGKGRITFKIGDGDKVSGHSGVNHYGSEAKFDRKNGISFGALLITNMGGPAEAMREEQLYLEKLGKITQWEISGRQLVLSDEKKSFGLVFETK